MPLTDGFPRTFYGSCFNKGASSAMPRTSKGFAVGLSVGSIFVLFEIVIIFNYLDC